MTALIIILCLIGIVGVLFVKVFLDTLYPLFKKNNVEEKKEETTPAPKQKWQWKTPEFIRPAAEWLIIIGVLWLLGWGCLCSITWLSKCIDEHDREVRATQRIVRKVYLQPMQCFEFTRSQKECYDYKPPQRTIISFLDENRKPMEVCVEGKWVYRYITTPGIDYETFHNKRPSYIVFQSVSSEPYSFDVAEF